MSVLLFVRMSLFFITVESCDRPPRVGSQSRFQERLCSAKGDGMHHGSLHATGSQYHGSRFCDSNFCVLVEWCRVRVPRRRKPAWGWWFLELCRRQLAKGRGIRIARSGCDFRHHLSLRICRLSLGDGAFLDRPRGNKVCSDGATW